MKFSKIWYVDTSQLNKMLEMLVFLVKKQPKLAKNEENWQNPNRLIKFSEIWYVNAFQHKEIQQKNYFSILAF